jgi:predicted amidohydrolase YtcJ
MVQRILHNGHIVTLNTQQPYASALAIDFGRVVAIGRDEDILLLQKPHTIIENLAGKTLIPGLTDAHIHWEWLSRALQSVDLFEVPSKAEAITRVAERVAKTAQGDWVTGRGWTQDLWVGGAFPTAEDLDNVAPDNPCYFSAKSGHAAWVNSKALERCGITPSTSDPEGGQIVRDSQGIPTGILLESAMKLVEDHIPNPTGEQLADAMHHAQSLALQAGITGIHDFDNPSCLYALQILRERGDLAIRVTKQINQKWLHHAIESGIRSGFGDAWIRFGALKLFADGALGPRTAYMLEPYEGEPNNTGIVVVPKEEMLDYMSRASAAGIASTVHAIGDAAVRDVLDVFEAIRQQEAQRGIPPQALRHRIEHVQIIHPDDVDRLAKLNIIASMQPIHATSDWEIATRYWGEERCELAYNARKQIDLGARVVFGSDSPVEPFEPLRGISAAVTRQRPDGTPAGGWYPDTRLTLDEALHGFTTGAAYATHMEHELGQLRVGYWADAVLLDKDPYAIPPEELLSLNILGTMVDGIWRFGGV